MGKDTAITPRCLDREQAAIYIGSSVDTIERAINLGLLPIVKLPVSRSKAGAKAGVNRRVLIDVKDLDALIERSKESRS